MRTLLDIKDACVLFFLLKQPQVFVQQPNSLITIWTLVLWMLLIGYPNCPTTSYTSFSPFFQHQRWFVLVSCPSHGIRFSFLSLYLSSPVPRFPQINLTGVSNSVPMSTILCFDNAGNTDAYQDFSCLFPQIFVDLIVILCTARYRLKLMNLSGGV